MNKYRWRSFRANRGRERERERQEKKVTFFSAFSFLLSIGENREVLFYKHWLLAEGRKEGEEREREKEEKARARTRERINFLQSFRPTMLIASCINIGPKREGEEEEEKEKIMNTNTSFCMQIEEKKKNVRGEEMCIGFC